MKPFISIERIWFIDKKPNNFGIEEKIKKLQLIIQNILNLLDNNSYNYKIIIIDTPKYKEKLLENLIEK